MKRSRRSWILNCFIKEPNAGLFFRRILCLSHPAMPIEFFMHYRGVRLWITIVRPQFPHYYTDTEWDTLHCSTTCVSASIVKFSYDLGDNFFSYHLQHMPKVSLVLAEFGPDCLKRHSETHCTAVPRVLVSLE